PAPPPQIATNVLIAWNRSTEQARATALAMSLLHKANRVTVLTVIGGTEVPGPSAEQIIQYLQRNGISAEPMKVELDGKNTGQAILAAAQSSDCDLLIKGAYTQSRLRQMIFGGATRHILENAEIPILLATCSEIQKIGVATGQSRLCADLYQLMRRVEKQQSHTLSTDRLWQDRRIGVETLASAQAESRTEEPFCITSF